MTWGLQVTDEPQRVLKRIFCSHITLSDYGIPSMSHLDALDQAGICFSISLTGVQKFLEGRLHRMKCPKCTPWSYRERADINVFDSAYFTLCKQHRQAASLTESKSSAWCTLRKKCSWAVGSTTVYLDSLRKCRFSKGFSENMALFYVNIKLSHVCSLQWPGHSIQFFRPKILVTW